MDGSRSPENVEPKPNRLVGLRQRVIDKLKRTPDVSPSTLHPAVLEAPEQEFNTEGAPFLIRISPGESAYEFSNVDWENWLSNNDKGLTNEPEEVKKNTGILMQDFVKGIREMYEEHLSRGNSFPIRPQVFYQLLGNSAASQKDGTRISITREYLLEKARQPIDMVQTDFGEFTDSKTPHFHGTPRQDMSSCGVHETDHAQWQQANPGFERTIAQTPGGGSSKARYDADPVELRALQEQLLHAQKHHFPPETMAVFEKRIAVAKVYQKLQSRGHTNT